MAYIGNSPANVGNFQVVDDISSTFNGTLKTFALTALTLPINPAKSGQLLVSINGVLQEPDDTGTEGFKVSGSNIVFSSAPATGSTFWAVWQGQAVDIGTPSDGVVGTAQMSYPLDNFTSTGIDDNATSTAITIDSAERVGLGTDNMQMYNVGGGNSTLVVTATSSATNVLANTDSNITIANGDGTADNTAALHFAREDTDGAPNYVGASVVSQFKETQVTGQYPKADLALLTSTATNTAPSEKMRITSSGNVGIGTDSPSGLLHLKGDTNANGAELFLQVNNNNTTDFLGAINFGNNGDTTLSRILSGTSGASNSSYLSFSNSSAGTAGESMRLDNVGNLTLKSTTGGTSQSHSIGTVLDSASGTAYDCYKQDLTLVFLQNTADHWIKVITPQSYDNHHGGGSATMKMSWLSEHASGSAMAKWDCVFGNTHTRTFNWAKSSVQIVQSSSSYYSLPTVAVAFYSQNADGNGLIGSNAYMRVLWIKVSGWVNYNRKRVFEISGVNGGESMKFEVSDFGATAPVNITGA